MADASILLLELTSDEVRDRLAAGWDTVVQSFGSTEGHLAHLPLGTDFYQSSRVAERVAQALGRAFVAPTISIGFAEGLLRFPGSMSVRSEILAEVVYDCCRSFAASGFRRAVLIVGHLGNCQPLGAGIERARADFSSLSVISDTTPDGFMAPVAQVGDELGRRDGALKHAGHAEASLMLAIRPDLVHLDRPPAAPAHSAQTAEAADFAGASSGAGDRYLQAWVAAIVANVRSAD